MYTFLVVFTAAIIFLVVYGYLHLLLVKKKFAKANKEDQKRRQERLDNLPVIPLSERDDEAIYQWSFHHGDRLVARAVGPEIDEAAKRQSSRKSPIVTCCCYRTNVISGSTNSRSIQLETQKRLTRQTRKKDASCVRLQPRSRATWNIKRSDNPLIP